MMHVPYTPRSDGWLDVGDGHTLYWQEWGNVDSSPVLFIHGGPGCGFDTGYLKLYNLDETRLITFDQRGSGASTAENLLHSNTTIHLLQDIEAIRLDRGIPKWHVTGHSWGTTLALLYAAQYSTSVHGLMLAGLFSARTVDHVWCLDGAQRFFPDFLADLKKRTGIDTTGRLDLTLAERMENASEAEQSLIARSLSNYFRKIAFLEPLANKEGPVKNSEIALWRIFLDYAVNDFYLNPHLGIFEPLLIDKLKAIPISLVHGRFDMDCPPEQAFLLKSLLPHMDLKIVAGNHDLEEEPMASAYKQAFTNMLASGKKSEVTVRSSIAPQI